MHPHPHLRELGQSYFHQDFDLEADTPVAVAALFGRVAAPETVEALRTEIASILDSDLDEDAVAHIWLEESEAYYDPRADGITPRDWLWQLAQALTGTDEK